MANKKLIRDLETLAYFSNCTDSRFIIDVARRALEEIEYLENELQQISKNFLDKP